MGGKYGFSARRASGIPVLKGRISRQISMPLTRSGSQRMVRPDDGVYGFFMLSSSPLGPGLSFRFSRF